MSDFEITIEDLKPISPFSQGSTEIFLTGLWSGRKPVYGDKTSPCRQACPIGNDISRSFYYASKGEYDRALKIYREDNPLPGVCGRVCYHPCEAGCNRRDFDEAINIRGFERFLADHGKVDIKRVVPARKRKERVAVIGSGPAGLGAAYHLARLGYGVTVFEALQEPGGMLMYGIPEYRLPKEVLRQEIGHIRDLGVEIRTGVRVGKDILFENLKKEYQATFIAIGAHAGMPLGIEGEDLPGVAEGIEFLRSVARGEKLNVGKRVAIIGGGNTAIDCARSARRMGAENVTVIYRRSRAEMPALPEDVHAAEAEGIKIEMLALPKRLVAENGRLTAVELIKMRLGASDSSGRPQPVAIEGSEYVVPMDMLIAAVGQTPESDLREGAGLSWNKRGMIDVSGSSALTGMEGVFAGGDCAGTKAFVADAIASGKRGALAIYCYLEGKDVNKEFENHRIGTAASFSFQHFLDPDRYLSDLKKIVPYEKVNTLCFSHAPRNDNPDGEQPGEGVKTFGEVVSGLDPALMSAEVERCFKCGTCTRCDFCFLICPDISIMKEEDGYRVRTDYCKGCSICATSCPRNVIEIGGGR